MALNLSLVSIRLEIGVCPRFSVPFLERIPDWNAYLFQGLDPAIEARIGYFTGTGYPMGADDWISTLETKSGRDLRPRPRGRPLKEATE